MDVLEGFPKEKWSDYLRTSAPRISFATKREEKAFLASLFADVKGLIEKGRIKKAVNNISLGLYINITVFFEILRKEGLLRHSRYLSKKVRVVSIIGAHILDNKDVFKLQSSDFDYLQSLIHFEKAYDELYSIDRFINSELRKFEKAEIFLSGSKKFKTSKLKALLAKADVAFLDQKESNRLCEDLTDSTFFGMEEVAEAISFLVSRYNDLIGFKEFDFQLTDDAYAAGRSIDVLIKEACRYKAILELEIEIHSYNFQCKKDNDSIIIFHSDEKFAKSIELSNIQYSLQRIVNVHYNNLTNSEVASIYETAKVFLDRFPQSFELKSFPTERYTMAIPAPFYELFLKQENPTFFREEINIIVDIAKELLVPTDILKTYELADGLTFMEFLRLLKFFILQSVLFRVKLTEVAEKTDRRLLYRSLVGVFPKEKLVESLLLFSTEETVEKFLKIISWDVDDKSTFFDLQYRPIIYRNGYYMIPGFVIGLANLPRSVFLSESKKGNNIKVFQQPNHTPIANVLSIAFERRKFKTYKELGIKYKTGKQDESDIDFMAYRDGMLFIGECKDTIHPTDVFEMRTTWNHIKKAASQLSYIRTALKDSYFLKNFCLKHKLDENKITTIEYCIILSNNKFWGYTYEGFPIRNFRELWGFLNKGSWNFGVSGESSMHFYLWREHEFDVKDLKEYLSENGPHSAMYNNCLEKKYYYGGNIYRKTYSLLMGEVVECLKTKYKYSEAPLNTFAKEEGG
jgi:hypothetical protein